MCILTDTASRKILWVERWWKRETMEQRTVKKNKSGCYLLRYTNTWTMKKWLRPIIIFSTELSDPEKRTSAFLKRKEEHKRTELLTIKQQGIILPYCSVTLLFPSALMDHHSSQFQYHRSAMEITVCCWDMYRVVVLSGLNRNSN